MQQSFAQYVPPTVKDTTRVGILNDINYKVEMQGSFSNTKTPLWLNANKYGLSSLEKQMVIFVLLFIDLCL